MVFKESATAKTACAAVRWLTCGGIRIVSHRSHADTLPLALLDDYWYATLVVGEQRTGAFVELRLSEARFLMLSFLFRGLRPFLAFHLINLNISNQSTR